MEFLLIFISAIFVNNIILSQFLGICPFLGVSQKVNTSLGMGAAVAFVMTLATIVTYLVQYYILNPLGLQYLQTIAFILVIAALVLVIQKDYSLLQSIVYAFSTAIGFALAITVFAGIREQLSLVKIPKGMQGVSIVLVTAGLLSLAFMGFSGVDGGLRSLFGLD